MTLRSLAGGRVFADIVGSGDSIVVLLHGWGRDRNDLLEVTRGMTERCVFVDLPGFGASPPPPEPWGAREYSDLIRLAIEDAAGPLNNSRRRIVLVGHSFGGRVALCLAAQQFVVAGIVLSGVPLLRPTGGMSPFPFRAMRALHRRGLIGQSTMERFRHRYGSADYRASQGVMRQTLVRVVGESYEAELGSLTCPVCLVWGDQDTAAPLTMVRDALSLIGAPSKLVLAESVGHDVHYLRPELLQREILALCRSTK